MERTKHIRPDRILTSDLHLREDAPICRTDDFWKAQWIKVNFIKKLQEKYQCPVLCAGDVFHLWKPSPYLISEAIKYLPNDFKAIYGQHDLPQHNIQLHHKSGLDTLKTASKLEILPGCHWGGTPSKKPVIIDEKSGRKILVWHRMTYQGKIPWPNCTDPAAIKLLKKYAEYDLIVTGDNHKPFVEKHEGRLLVNPGSLTRQAADQINHKPRIYLWYAETNTVKPIYLPITNDVISREHIEVKQERDKRIDAFVERLDTGFEFNQDTTDIETGIENYAKANDIPQSIIEIVLRAITSKEE